MDKFLAFINKWHYAILLVLFSFLYLGQCSTNRTIEKQRKDNLQLSSKIDTLETTIKSYKPITNIDLRIEGLKSEKRMIQATDRKMLDVNRQTEIEKEIEKLQNK